MRDCATLSPLMALSMQFTSILMSSLVSGCVAIIKLPSVSVDTTTPSLYHKEPTMSKRKSMQDDMPAMQYEDDKPTMMPDYSERYMDYYKVDPETGEIVRQYPQWYLDKLADKNLTPDGKEIPDPTPMEPPVGFVKQPSMFDYVRSMVARELANRAEEVDGPEDAADMGDDDDEIVEALTKYEAHDLEVALALKTDRAAKAQADAERLKSARDLAHRKSAEGPAGEAGGKSAGEASKAGLELTSEQ